MSIKLNVQFYSQFENHGKLFSLPLFNQTNAMLLEEHITYLIDMVFFSTAEQKVQYAVFFYESHFEIRMQKQTYKEGIFDFENPILTNNDKLFLDSILVKAFETHDVEQLQSLYKKVDFADIPICKIVHYFVNERYITKPQNADIHQRITSDCVDETISPYLHIPIVDILIDAFLYKVTGYIKPKSTLYLTSDFDYINLWDYLGFCRSLWRLLRHLFMLRFHLIGKELLSFLYSKKELSRNVVLTDSMFIKPIENRWYKTENIAFLLCEYSNKQFDENNDLSQPSFTKYIEKHKDYVSFGIHPAYNTGNNPSSLQQQLQTFETIMNQHARLSRFHYLKCRYPYDLEFLERQGIVADFSFYFVDSLLFRGGISRSFKQWSFRLLRPIEVSIIPLTIMDVTLDQTLKLSYEKALCVSCNKTKTALFLGHSCVLLWHNNSMYDHISKNNYHPKLFKQTMCFLEHLQ